MHCSYGPAHPYRFRMLYIPRALIIGGLLAALPVRAVYAPIPEQEQGKNLIFSVRGGISYDSNIFGASGVGAMQPGTAVNATEERDSVIFTVAPKATYYASLTAQTFFSASYGLTLDRFVDRPGDKLLDSHDASVRLAHAFSKATIIDLNDSFIVSRNPESLLPGQTLNTNQSFTRNQLDGRFVTPVTAKIGATVKARSIYYDYHDRQLGQSLDRIENLYGISGDYAILPEVKGVAEYRHQDVFYRTQGELKSKKSEYLMAGADYDLAAKMSLSGRLGAEWRKRRGDENVTAPYAEISAKYDYAEKSFLTGGYAYTLEETSDPERFTDTKLHRLFANVQHSLTPLIVASGSLTYEPARLQGRRGNPNISETSMRGGAALSYLPTRNWTLSAGYDYDRVRSDDPARKLRRNRVALSAIFTF
jgi:opacity protein-like surface antigen